VPRALGACRRRPSSAHAAAGRRPDPDPGGEPGVIGVTDGACRAHPYARLNAHYPPPKHQVLGLGENIFREPQGRIHEDMLEKRGFLRAPSEGAGPRYWRPGRRFACLGLVSCGG